MLKNLQSRNTLVKLANKFLQASIESSIKKDSDKALKYENEASDIADCLNHIEWLISNLEKECVKNADLTRVVAIQEQELTYLKQKVERLNNEIQFRDL